LPAFQCDVLLHSWLALLVIPQTGCPSFLYSIFFLPGPQQCSLANCGESCAGPLLPRHQLSSLSHSRLYRGKRPNRFFSIVRLGCEIPLGTAFSIPSPRSPLLSLAPSPFFSSSFHLLLRHFPRRALYSRSVLPAPPRSRNALTKVAKV